MLRSFTISIKFTWCKHYKTSTQYARLKVHKYNKLIILINFMSY